MFCVPQKKENHRFGTTQRLVNVVLGKIQNEQNSKVKLVHYFIQFKILICHIHDYIESI